MNNLKEENGTNASYWIYDAITCAQTAFEYCEDDEITKEIDAVLENMKNILVKLYEKERNDIIET